MNGIESENNLRLFINDRNENEKVQGLSRYQSMVTDENILR